MRRFTAGVLVLLGCGPGQEPAAEPRRVDAGRLGSVRIFEPAEERQALVVVFSDAGGWNADLDAAARGLVDEGAVVAGVDLPGYLAALAASDDGCHYVVSELEDLAHRLERELGFTSYRSPVLAGIGAGGTLAYAALAQSPAATVAGAVSIDPSERLATRVPLCSGAPASAGAGGFAYGPAPALRGFWRVDATAPLPPDLAALANTGPEEEEAPAPAERKPAERLVAAVSEALAAEQAGLDEEIADLPVVVLPGEPPSALGAIIYSGDGGWRDLDKEIGEALSEHGVAVVGVDSLRYFWNERTPEDVAEDLARLLRYLRDRTGRSRMLLVGYSFGAGILPFAVNRLPDAERALVAQVSLLGLEAHASFEIEVSGWLGEEASAEAPAVLPELLRLDLSRVQCFYGEEEEDSLCRDPALAGAEIVRTAGGHHFDGDYPALAATILAGAERRALPAGPQRATTPRTPPDTSAATSVRTKGTASPPGEAR